VGQAAVQGASKQFRQRLASTIAACGVNAGFSSGKRAVIPACGVNAVPKIVALRSNELIVEIASYPFPQSKSIESGVSLFVPITGKK